MPDNNNPSQTIQLKIKRQEGPEATPYWEEFEIPYRPHMNVVSCLMEIRKNPVNAQGKPTTPVVWESVCLEEVCGACSMLINNIPRQACSALVDSLKQPITLAPLSKFSLVRDLKVDRPNYLTHSSVFMGGLILMAPSIWDQDPECQNADDAGLTNYRNA